MDIPANLMDYSANMKDKKNKPSWFGLKHLHIETDKIRRSFAFPMPVQAIGVVPPSAMHTRPFVHPTLNFCFLLSGTPSQLEAGCDNLRFTKRFPCLMVHIPGKTYVNLAESVVEELYVAYDAGLLPAFRRALPGLETPCHEIVVSPSFSTLVKNIHYLIENCHDIGAVDRLDICCYQLIIEALLDSAGKKRSNAPDMIVRRIASFLETNFTEPIAWQDLLITHGISYRSFIRHWQQAYQASPTRYINTLRVREAQRLLITTGSSIKEIARLIGVEDVYYFSRIFKAIAGISPNAYRRKKHMQPSLSPACRAN